MAYPNPYVRRWDPYTQETYYEHQAVAEMKLGRPLEPGEVVHHDDGNKRHNHPDNIWIFSSQPSSPSLAQSLKCLSATPLQPASRPTDPGFATARPNSSTF